jgi:hypothetical protein
MADDSQQLKTPADAGKGAVGEVKRWLIELDYSDKIEKDWRARGANVVARYRGENAYDKTNAVSRTKETFNILWSNVETMRPAIYNSTPEPVVSDRFGGADPVTKAAIEVLRRSLKYTLTTQDFDQTMNLVVQDYLLPGRAGARVRYVPTFAPGASVQGAATPAAPPMGPSGEMLPQSETQNMQAETPTDTLAFEEVKFDLIEWAGFRRGHAEVWDDLPWQAFERELRYEELCDLVGKEMADKVPLSAKRLDDSGAQTTKDDQDEGVFKTAQVFEIWDRRAREVVYVAPAYKASVLKKVKDEYNLTGFFPQPRMLYAVETSESLIPVTEFSQYETLANDLETLTNRMAKLARAISVRGAYPKDLPELEKLLEETDTKLIPTENADRYMELGGLQKAIMFLPIDTLIAGYQALGVERENVKNAIFELIGAADIMRGATEAVETASAQKLKSRWGSVRLRRRQAEIERFCRDLLSMAAELIAEKFSLQTLKMMTGCEYPMKADQMAAQQTVQALTQVQQLAQQNPQLAQQVPPQMMQQGQAALQKAQGVLGQPCWEDIVAFLRNDAMRRFKVDVQTDSTIALQQADDQSELAKMMTAISTMIGEIMPLVQGGSLPFDAAKKLLVGATRRFRLGYEVADALDQMVQPPAPDPMKNPKIIEAQVKAKANAEASAASDQARAQADVAIEQHKTGVEAQVDQEKAQLGAMVKMIEQLPAIIIQHLKNVGAIEVARVNGGIDLGDTILSHELAASEQTPNVPGLTQ